MPGVTPQVTRKKRVVRRRKYSWRHHRPSQVYVEGHRMNVGSGDTVIFTHYSGSFVEKKRHCQCDLVKRINHGKFKMRGQWISTRPIRQSDGTLSSLEITTIIENTSLMTGGMNSRRIDVKVANQKTK